MGDDFRRTATLAEVAQMATLLDREMRDGAIALSLGLEYEVGSYASTEEVVSLARVAGSLAFSPVQLTHLKLGTVDVWNKAPEVVALVAAARKRGVDVTADVYPYLAWSSNIKVLVPNKQWTDPASAEGVSEVDLYIRIVTDEGAGMIGHTMIAADMQMFLRQPWAMVASDGGIANNHPRGAGTFPRVLRRFVRDEQWLTLPDAVRKMTTMPAARLGLKDRGAIAVGMKADLVLFDPATVLDQSTFENPRLLARGIHTVLVNGAPVWSGERATGLRPGQVLIRK